MNYIVPKLYKYVGKYVSATASNGKVFTGKVIGFEDKFENESGEDCITIDWGQTYVTDLNESEIVSIEVLGE